MSLTTDGGFGLQNYMDMLHEDRTSKAIRNTLIISIASTVIAVAAGSFFAFLNAYTNIKRKKLLELLVLAPYIIPSYIITLSWSSLLLKRGLVNTFLKNIGLPVIDIYTLPGIILVMGICNIPVVYLLVVGMLRKIPRDMEWAGRTSGYTPLQTIRKITMVQAMPAIASGGMLAFLASIDNFSIPAFLGISSGIPVLSTYIYEKAISFGPDSFHKAAALSVVLSLYRDRRNSSSGKTDPEEFESGECQGRHLCPLRTSREVETDLRVGKSHDSCGIYGGAGALHDHERFFKELRHEIPPGEPFPQKFPVCIYKCGCPPGGDKQHSVSGCHLYHLYRCGNSDGVYEGAEKLEGCEDV
ncbi:MAG: ABC transporter permease [Clostridium sp.]